MISRLIMVAALLASTSAMAQMSPMTSRRMESPILRDMGLADCTGGALGRNFAGSLWTVHTCLDGRSLLFTAAHGSRAAPCYFLLQHHKGGSYEMLGECSGNKATDDMAANQIGALTPDEIKDLYWRTAG